MKSWGRPLGARVAQGRQLRCIQSLRGGEVHGPRCGPVAHQLRSRTPDGVGLSRPCWRTRRSCPRRGLRRSDAGPRHDAASGVSHALTARRLRGECRRAWRCDPRSAGRSGSQSSPRSPMFRRRPGSAEDRGSRGSDAEGAVLQRIAAPTAETRLSTVGASRLSARLALALRSPHARTMGDASPALARPSDRAASTRFTPVAP